MSAAVAITPRPSWVAALLCSFVNSVTDKLTGALSLGAAVFASVLIASCMPAEMDVVGAWLLWLVMPMAARGQHHTVWTTSCWLQPGMPGCCCDD